MSTFVCPLTVNSISESKSIGHRIWMVFSQRLTDLIGTENQMSGGLL